jgi:UDP-N-acetylmuramate: L-alanyl-gamma-D-glutamyl-meso-diaminopimelate ligase
MQRTFYLILKRILVFSMHLKTQKIHLIAIGGSIMHSLAIALKQAGHHITGSDDEIAEPSRSALAEHGLLPDKEGWAPEKLDTGTDLVILGMHARGNNPEVLKAQLLGLKIISFPEYIYEQSREKQRIVIAGSHGKTTITAIIIHVLKYFNRKFDHVVGARIPGIENAVKLSDAPIIIIEGDEYPSSPLDPTPKFIRYQHHVGLISGISWDHANVFPSEEEYVKQFDRFADNTPKGGILIFCEQDSMALMIGKKERPDSIQIAYKAHAHTSDATGNSALTNGKEKYPIKLFGNHNFQNLSGAKEILKKIGITPEQFLEAIASFKGAAGRLEKIAENNTTVVYKDYAHSPSKVKATVKALKEAFPTRELVACLELHTYSSLNKGFLPQYKDSLKAAHTLAIYINPETSKAKAQEVLSEAEIRSAFGAASIQVFTESTKLETFLLLQSWKNKNLLIMSSGNLGDLNIQTLAQKIAT